MLVQLGFIFSDESGGANSGFGWSEVMAFGAVILVMAIMPKIIRKIRRERMALVKHEVKSIENSPNIRSQADKVLVDLAEVSREINAQSDTKIRVLNKLVRDAEKAIARLEELLEREEALVEQRTGVKPKVQKTKPVVHDSAEIRMVEKPSEDSRQVKSECQDIVSDKGVDSNKPSRNKESGVWQDTIGAKISKLHAQGFDVSEIARKTRVSVSEVTLMLEIINNGR